MARSVRHSTFESRTARLKLQIRGKPYRGPKLGRGLRMDYRRNVHNGSYVAVMANGKGGYETDAVCQADDYDEADPARGIYDFFGACDLVKKRARAPSDDGDGAGGLAPITWSGALKDYGEDLKARGAGTYNADHPRAHLSATLLARPVQELTAAELKKWCNSLNGKIAPATINRLLNSVCAAFELAARHDKRIANHDAWAVGLERLPDAERARNVVIGDDKVRAFVAAAYCRDAGLGLFTEVLAETGCRSGQAARLHVEDLQDHPQRPRLLMPRSGKGGGRNRSDKKHEQFSVSITPQLARKLKLAAQGRAAEAQLLLRLDGSPWGADPNRYYREPVRAIVESIGLDPGQITMYALRHSSIVRMLLARRPVQLTANLHDTSPAQLQSNYAKFITEHIGDEYAQVLLQPEPPPAADDDVITLPGR